MEIKTQIEAFQKENTNLKKKINPLEIQKEEFLYAINKRVEMSKEIEDLKKELSLARRKITISENKQEELEKELSIFKKIADKKH